MRIVDLVAGLEITGGEASALAGDPRLDARVCDVTEDSRTVMPGSLFIARRGIKSDGRAFVKQAIDAGAVAVLSDDPALPAPQGSGVVMLVATDLEGAIAQIAERFYGEPSSKLALIGVTGTNGKTTITFLMHQMLNALGVRCGLIGTVVIDDGVETAPASMTTPPALELSRTLARMLEAGCKAAVMEVSSHALHQRRVGALRFRAGVFTNLTGDHLDFHKTMDNYAAAKAMLFAMLPERGVAVLNISDAWHSRMVQDCPARRLRCRQIGVGEALPVTGGTAPETVLTARVVGAGPASTDIEIAGGALAAYGGPRRVCIPLVGDFNVINALQGFAALWGVFGPDGSAQLSADQLVQALARVHAPPGRLEPVSHPDAPLCVLVDYAHTDDALKTVLSTVRGAMDRARDHRPDRAAGGTAPGQLWCVFGCGGDRDRTKRPRMGKVAAELADQVVITSDNPRTEDPEAIIREVQSGVPDLAHDRVAVEADRDRAIRMAIRSAKPGDTIVIAGKGHEDYQIFADPAKPGATITRHFDDREVAREALLARGIAVREAPSPAQREDTLGQDMPGQDMLGQDMADW